MEQHVSALEAQQVNDEKHRNSAEKYVLNYYLMLAMQLLGLSVETIGLFLGLLGMRTTMGNTDRWKRIQEQLGKAEETVKDEVILENQDAECEATLEKDPSRCDEDGRVGVTASSDAGWQKRSAGRSYDSPSGHILQATQGFRNQNCVGTS